MSLSRRPAVDPWGGVEWPRGSERDAFDVDLVRRADDGDDDAALELLHRDAVRASIAWKRFLKGGLVLPRSCVYTASVARADR